MISLIPPELRARLRDLRLAARGGAGGDGLGQHASRSRGAGLEFAQYRAYEPGDELRRIDWKLYARSDRYFVREAERDSPLTAWAIVDASASMRQADAVRRGYAKLDAAKTLAACVFELALRQGDRFGLLALGGGTLPADVPRPRSGRGEDHRRSRGWGEGESASADSVALAAAAPTFVPAGAGPRQRDRCFLELARLQAAGRWPEAAALRPLWERVQPSAVVVMLSDFFDDEAAELALRLAAARREVLTVQMLSADERDFPFAGGHRLRDPESGAERRVEASAVRKDYLERFAAARAELACRFGAAGIRHVEYVLDRPLDEPLRTLFGSGDRLKPPPSRGRLEGDGFARSRHEDRHADPSPPPEGEGFKT